MQYEIWAENGLRRDMVFAILVAFAIQFFIQTRRLIGPRTLRNFLIGRYSHPVREQRIFVLADMVGSTAMAEQLGDEAALSLITSFFQDLDPAIQRNGGEIHNYVGDEIVMSWPMKSPTKNGRVLQAVQDILTLTETRRTHYLEKYGLAPALRIGVAGGNVAIGECGWEKRQVVYIGDTLNVAKRLQEACKQRGLHVLIEGKTADGMALPDGLALRKIGEEKLRGHGHPTRLVTLAAEELDRQAFVA